jgi:hypothetical protein
MTEHSPRATGDIQTKIEKEDVPPGMMAAQRDQRPMATALLSRLLSLITLLLALFAVGQGMAQTPANGNLRETSIPAQAFVRGAALPSWFQRQLELPPTDSRDPIVMRLGDSHFRVDAVPSTVYHRAIQVNESSALSEIGQYSIAFQPDYQRIELHWLKVHRAGEVIDKLDDASLRFYHAEQSANQGIYSGSITAVVISQDLRPGDTLEIIYSVIGQNPVFAGHFIDAAAWETTIPVIKRRVILDQPAGRNIRHRIIGANNAPLVSEAKRGERHLVRYEADNLPAIDQEALLPPDVQAQSWIQFSEFRDWQEVVQWGDSLFSRDNLGNFTLPDLGKTASKAELLMRALQFVQNDIRYLSISIGENSHRPAPPGEVLARRYGDCKDKSYLLVAMLRRLGIEASPVLVSTQMRKGIDKLLPSSSPFDHAIVRASVDGKTYFLDPTLQHQGRRLDKLGLYLAGAEALVIRDGGRALELIPAQRADSTPLSSRLEQVTLTRMGEPAEMKLELSYRAENAESARRVISSMSPEQLRKAYASLLDQRYPTAQFVGDPKITDDQDNNVLSIQLLYRIPNLFEKQGERWSMRYEASNLANALPSTNNAKRRFPLSIPAHPWAGRYKLDITLPEEYDANYKPEQHSLQGEAFKLDESLHFQGRQLGLEVGLEISRDRVAAAGTAQYLTDLRQANNYLRGSLTLSERDLRKTVAATVPLRELSRQRLEQALRNSATTITAARSAGRETAGARCEHALAAAYLNQPGVAVEDAEAAVSEQPASPDSLRCRGTVRFVVGDFEGAIRDLSRALSLGQDELETYFQRGLAHYYAGHWRKAAEDFASYGGRSKDERIVARAFVWQTLALQPIGLTPPASDRHGTAWPAAALALFDNKSSAEDVMENLNRSERGIQLEEAVAEAYFYFFRNLASSNRAKAQAYLRRSLELGALYSLIQVAARHEMARLTSPLSPTTPSGKQP